MAELKPRTRDSCILPSLWISPAFQKRKLKSPGHAFCRVGSLATSDSRIRSLLWLSTKAVETLTCSGSELCQAMLIALLCSCPLSPCLLIVLSLFLSGLKSMLRKDTSAGIQGGAIILEYLQEPRLINGLGTFEPPTLCPQAVSKLVI